MKTRLGMSGLKFTTPLVIAGALFLAGCGGSDAPQAPPPEPTPSAYEVALEAIQGAETEAAAQAVYDMVDQGAITGAEAALLMAALQTRLDYLAKMARIEAQKNALSMAAAGVDTSDLSTRDAVAAAKAAIAMLQAALNNAADVSDADKAMYQSTLDDANDDVRMAETGLNKQDRIVVQRNAISNAVTAARDAVNAVNDGSDDAEVMAADNAIAALQTAIDDAVDIPAGDTDVASAQGTLATLEGQLSSAKTSRMAALDEADRKALEDAMKMAAKLYGAIGTERTVEDNVAIAGANLNLGVTDAGATPPTVQRTLKKGAVADALGDWSGQQYASSDGKHNANLYSMMGDPTMGAKFSAAVATITGFGTANANGEYPITTIADIEADDVVIDDFSRTSGTHTFEFEDHEDPEGRHMLAGSYDGVRGYYFCDPPDPGDCTASVTNSDGTGITLGTGTWTFKPNNADDRITETPGSTFAFGWWLDESGDSPVVRVFTSAPDATTGVPGADLRGTATYTGAAAGKYTLNRGQGGENDSGHFTADATLEATFDTAHSIEGTIDGFVGADGQSRDWSVALESIVMEANGAGVATVDVGTTDVDESLTTIWTIGGEAANAAGSWVTNLTGSDGGTPTIATGTFNAGYNNVGRMIGAFGAEKEEE